MKKDHEHHFEFVMTGTDELSHPRGYYRCECGMEIKGD